MITDKQKLNFDQVTRTATSKSFNRQKMLNPALTNFKEPTISVKCKILFLPIKGIKENNFKFL